MEETDGEKKGILLRKRPRDAEQGILGASRMGIRWAAARHAHAKEDVRKGTDGKEESGPSRVRAYARIPFSVRRTHAHA